MTWRRITDAQKDGHTHVVGAVGYISTTAYWNGVCWDDGDFCSDWTWPTHWWDFGDGAPMPPEVQE